MKKKKKKEKFVDDGRVIAPMNVEGMPWYVQKRQPRAAGDSSPIPEKMTRRESAAFASGVLKAALLVTFAFVGVFFLFILFCIYVWFA